MFSFEFFAMRQQEIEDFIDALITTSDPNDYFNQRAAAMYVRLDLDSLTSDEVEYIEREVSKRCQCTLDSI